MCCVTPRIMICLHFFSFSYRDTILYNYNILPHMHVSHPLARTAPDRRHHGDADEKAGYADGGRDAGREGRGDRGCIRGCY